MGTFNPDEFVFDEFWKRIPKEGKQILTEIARQLSHSFFSGNKWKNKKKEWGGRAFWDYISVFGMGIKEQQAFRKSVDKFTGGNLKTISDVGKQGLGGQSVKIAFCFSAYIQQHFRKITIRAFIIGFREYAEECSSHIDFEELDDAFKELAESKSNQPRSITELESKKSEILNRLIEIPLNEDSEKGITSLSPKDHRSFPLRGRDDELERLDSLLSDDAPYKLQFVIAPSGAGKTRLVTEWFRTRNVPKKWQAGFANQDNLSEQWLEWASQELTCDTLIVIDYIYRFKEVVRAITDKGIDYHQRINKERKDNKGSDTKAPNYPRLRLVILEHVLPDNAQYQTLPHHLKEALGERNSAVNLKLRDDVKAPDISLNYTDNEKHEDLIKTIISDASGFSEESEEVFKAYETLEKMDKAANIDDNTSSPVFSRFPLFAILIGQALRDNRIDKIQHWKRSELMGQYFTEDRLPWKKDKINGRWTGALVSAATLLQGLDYEFMFSKLAICQINFTENDLKDNCVSIVASDDRTTLKKYEPDILGETFTLLFLQEYRWGVSEKIDGKNINVKAVFFSLLCGASSDDNGSPTINNRFIETLQRMARNLSNDNQGSPHIQNLWKTLGDMLAPNNYTTATMKLSASVASMEVVKIIQNEPQWTDNQHIRKFLSACEHGLLAEAFKKLNADISIEKRFESVWSMLLSALSVFMDASLALNIKSETSMVVFDCIFREYEKHSPNKKTRLFIPALHNTPNLLNWMVKKYSEIDVNAQDSIFGNALMSACFFGHSKVLSSLLAIPSIEVNQFNKEGWTAFMLACYCGYEDVVEHLLVVPDIAVNHQAVHGVNALMVAIQENNETVVARLLDIPDISVNQCDYHGQTALMHAVQTGNEALVALLLDVPDISVNDHNWLGETALMDASIQGNQNILERLLLHPQIDVNRNGNNGYTALMYASKNGHTDIVQRLLDFPRIEVERTMHNGRTALILASERAWAC